MDRIAVFVDAGYLYAQGSALLSGAKKKRQFLQLNELEIEASLRRVLISIGSTNLLRIYWYDAVNTSRGPTADHQRIANRDNFKLRLGFLNSHGEQKGVDSLIVTDMVELARNKAISDAVLLSGDEDVRIGVQLAQNHGMRVHLLGIKPSRGSQSITLMQEADTNREWDEGVVSAFLTILPEPEAVRDVQPGTGAPVVVEQRTVETTTTAVVLGASIQDIAKDFCGQLNSDEVTACGQFWAGGQRGVPPDLDRRLLGACKMALGGVQLERDQVREARRAFNVNVRPMVDPKT